MAPPTPPTSMAPSTPTTTSLPLYCATASLQSLSLPLITILKVRSIDPMDDQVQIYCFTYYSIEFYSLPISNYSIDRFQSRRKETVLDLAKFIYKGVQVKLTGGRQVIGTLKGYDKLLNFVLSRQEVDTRRFLFICSAPPRRDTRTTISLSSKPKIAYTPGERFSLRDFNHAVHNMPQESFLMIWEVLLPQLRI